MVKRTPTRRRAAAATDRHRGAIDLLWGEAERGGRGPRPALSVAAVVQAAIAVADAEGLASVTMARVAARLDVTTMALYRYVPGKEELLDLMIDAALDSPPPPRGGDWRSEAAQWARSVLAVYRRRPWLLDAVTRRAPIGPNWLAWLNALLGQLSLSGLVPRETVAATLLIDGHVRSAAQLAMGAAGTKQWTENFGRVLESIRDDPRYAALARVARDGGFDAAPDAGADEFEFGLARLLEGIDAHVRRGAAPHRQGRSARSLPARGRA